MCIYRVNPRTFPSSQLRPHGYPAGLTRGPPTLLPRVTLPAFAASPTTHPLQGTLPES